MTQRQLRRIFAAIVITFTVGATMQLVGCASKLGPTWHVHKAVDAYPNLTEIHQNREHRDVVEGFDGNDHIILQVKRNEVRELGRYPRHTGIDAAEAGQLADIGTTGIGLAQGFTEANPLGITIIPLKYALNHEIEETMSHDCRAGKKVLSGLGWGFAAANVATIATGGVAAPSLLAGLAAGYFGFNADSGGGCVWLGDPVKL